jgi:hypothetical protein
MSISNLLGATMVAGAHDHGAGVDPATDPALRRSRGPGRRRPRRVTSAGATAARAAGFGAARAALSALGSGTSRRHPAGGGDAGERAPAAA